MLPPKSSPVGLGGWDWVYTSSIQMVAESTLKVQWKEFCELIKTTFSKSKYLKYFTTSFEILNTCMWQNQDFLPSQTSAHVDLDRKKACSYVLLHNPAVSNNDLGESQTRFQVRKIFHRGLLQSKDMYVPKSGLYNLPNQCVHTNLDRKKILQCVQVVLPLLPTIHFEATCNRMGLKVVSIESEVHTHKHRHLLQFFHGNLQRVRFSFQLHHHWGTHTEDIFQTRVKECAPRQSHI